jgi:hypothetical protein
MSRKNIGDQKLEKIVRFPNLFFRAIVVMALVVVLGLQPLGSVRATSNTAVYVLGVSNPTDPLIIDLQSLTSSVTLLTSAGSLATLSAGSILYVDGSWLSSASSQDPTIIPTIVQTILTGLPTIEVRGDPSILANSVSGLVKFQNPGLPLIAEGVHISATLPGGLQQGELLRIISGFDYSVAAEFQWATSQIAQPSLPALASPLVKAGSRVNPTAPTLSNSSPFWQLILQASTDTGNQFSPFGQVVTTFSIYQLQNSGSTSSKWFDIFTNQTVTPGIVAFNSNYRNYQEITSAHPNDQTTNIFVNNGPPSQISSGPTTVSYSIGTIAGQFNDTVTSTQAMSYALKSANVTNTSASPAVGWIHTINGGTSAGKLILQFIPGWTDEVAQRHPLTVSGDLQVVFATFSNSNTASVTQTQTTDLSFEIFGGGG